jgi:hypothetical protein
MSIIDHTWILNRARSFLGQNVTGQVDFKDEDILACLDQETLPTLSVYLPYLYEPMELTGPSPPTAAPRSGGNMTWWHWGEIIA